MGSLKKTKTTKSSYDKVKKLRKLADEWWRSKCIEKWGNKCILCGKPVKNCHHFIPRSESALLRHDIENCVPLCFYHHHHFHDTGNPQIIRQIIERRGKEWEKYIFEKADLTSPNINTVRYLENKIIELQYS